MKTKATAIRRWKSRMGVKGVPFVVYQFPAGHWRCASKDSPVAHDLQDTGYIYCDINVKARHWEWVA